MNLRKIKLLRSRSWLGKLVRLPFRLIPQHAVIPVLFGFLRNRKWIKGSHNISVLLGTYERRQSSEFYSRARGKQVFWDLGAHVGYYSLLYHVANPHGRSFGFEPLRSNAQLQQRHMELNAVHNHQIFTVAVSDTVGTLTFDLGRTSVAGKLAANGEVKVNVVRLSNWIESGVVPVPDLIKMDIEGEELKVLNDLKSMLKLYKPDIFLSTHGKATHQKAVELLESLEYSLTPLDAKDIQSCRELLCHATQ